MLGLHGGGYFSGRSNFGGHICVCQDFPARSIFSTLFAISAAAMRPLATAVYCSNLCQGLEIEEGGARGGRWTVTISNAARSI